MSELWYGIPFVLILALVAAWQHILNGRKRDATVEGVREARELGANRPENQYPKINPWSCIGCGSCIRACPEHGVIELVDGIAHVVRAASCVGHALCEQSCPVGAIRVGLGELVDRPDRPRLTSEFETTIPGVFVAGELGGIALISNAVKAGTAAIDAIAARPRGTPSGTPVSGVVGVLIVGAGPCGMTATLRAIEHGLTWITIDQDDVGGTVRKYPRRKLVLTQPVDLPLGERLRRREYSKEELVEFWTDCLDRHGADVRAGVSFQGLRREGETFEVESSDGPIRCRHVLLALGRRGTPRQLGVPGEQDERVLYQLVDATTYRSLRLLVVGGGDSALEAAWSIADQPGTDVTLSYRNETFSRAKPKNRKKVEGAASSGRLRVLMSSRVIGIGEEMIEIETAEGSMQLDNDAVIVCAGGILPTELLLSMNIEIVTKRGEL